MATESIKSTVTKADEPISPYKPRTPGMQALKRVFDIIMASLGLLFLWPLFLFIAILIKRDSSGPVFYRGPRVGKNGKLFGILKFRTMREDPESYAGPRLTAEGDARITPTGQWLRNTKINELPQLWNVLKGEMSMVGPRPEDPEIAADWPEDARREILSVRPGITSPSSVAYHDEEQHLKSADVMGEYLERIQPNKLRLDRLYVRHHSFLTDLDAIFWTLIILVPRFGKNTISEGWLFGGPFSRLLRSYVSWFSIDFVLALFGIGAVGLIWRANHPLEIGVQRALGLAIVFAFLFGVINTLLGIKTVSWSRAAPEDALRLFVAALLVILINAVGIQLSSPISLLPLDFVFTASLVVLILCVIVRYRLRVITGLASRWVNLRKNSYGAGERVLIVGAGEGGSFAAWLLRHSDFQRIYSVIGMVDDDPAKQGRRYDGFKVMGTTADIPNLVRQHDVGVIFYAISKISTADSERIQKICKDTGRHMVVISNLIQMLQEHLSNGS